MDESSRSETCETPAAMAKNNGRGRRQRRRSYSWPPPSDLLADKGSSSDRTDDPSHPSIHLSIPPPPPETWPQRPILLRPTPGSGTTIHGIRFSSSTAYLPPNAVNSGDDDNIMLPINNGMEKPGKCMVIDFESDLFIGTILMRVKNICPSPLLESSHDTITPTSTSYFDGKIRTFQGIVKGRFKQPNVSISECVTGQVFHRRAGSLPPRFIVNGAIGMIRLLAPALEARLDCDRPRFLSPLVSTAQGVMMSSPIQCQHQLVADKTTVAMVEDKNYGGCWANESIENETNEPQPSDLSSLLQQLLHSKAEYSLPPDSDRIATRVKARKRAFDMVRARQDTSLVFDPNRLYTFEFFQHLVSLDEFAIHFMKPIGMWPLRSILDGQSLKFMAAYQTRNNLMSIDDMRYLWSFDLWHESLMHDACKHDTRQNCTQQNNMSTAKAG